MSPTRPSTSQAVKLTVLESFVKNLCGHGDLIGVLIDSSIWSNLRSSGVFGGAPYAFSLVALMEAVLFCLSLAFGRSVTFVVPEAIDICEDDLDVGGIT